MTLEEYRAAIERLPSMVELARRTTDLELAVARLIGSNAGDAILDRIEAVVKAQKPEPQFSDSPEHQTICRYISDTPALFSLLYDLNLLPEQVESNSRDETIMAHITMAWRANAETATPALLDAHKQHLSDMTTAAQAAIDRLEWHDAKTDPPKTPGYFVAVGGNMFGNLLVRGMHYNGSHWLYTDTKTPMEGDSGITHWAEFPPL